MRTPRIAVIVSGFPRYSETFALNEIAALKSRGMLARLFATKPGDGGPLQPSAFGLMQDVQILPPGDPAAQAKTVAAMLLDEPVDAIHAYFAHTPLTVAAGAAAARNVPYGFSVHARDARKVERSELIQRARGAACAIACNGDVAAELQAAGVEVDLLPHGVDTNRFCYVRPTNVSPTRLLAVGRLVKKKGFSVLLQALPQMQSAVRLRVIGAGPEEARLRGQVTQLGLESAVEFHEPQNHDQMPGEYQRTDIVVVPSIVDESGDRDGLPNVVLEAMASGRPVVATDAGAICSAVRDGETGRIVPQHNARQLAIALDELSDAADLRRELGERARLRAVSTWSLDQCTSRFCDFLRAKYA